MSVKMVWCIIARNSAATLPFPWNNTRERIWSASTSRRNPALPAAPFPVCRRSPFSIIGAIPRYARPLIPLQLPPCSLNPSLPAKTDAEFECQKRPLITLEWECDVVSANLPTVGNIPASEKISATAGYPPESGASAWRDSELDFVPQPMQVFDFHLTFLNLAFEIQQVRLDGKPMISKCGAIAHVCDRVAPVPRQPCARHIDAHHGPLRLIRIQIQSRNGMTTSNAPA